MRRCRCMIPGLKNTTRSVPDLPTLPFAMSFCMSFAINTLTILSNHRVNGENVLAEMSLISPIKCHKVPWGNWKDTKFEFVVTSTQKRMKRHSFQTSTVADIFQILAIGGFKGALGTLPTFGGISFIFMKFLAKYCQLIGFCFKIKDWRPHPRLGNPWSATAGDDWIVHSHKPFLNPILKHRSKLCEFF